MIRRLLAPLLVCCLLVGCSGDDDGADGTTDGSSAPDSGTATDGSAVTDPTGTTPDGETGSTAGGGPQGATAQAVADATAAVTAIAAGQPSTDGVDLDLRSTVEQLRSAIEDVSDECELVALSESVSALPPPAGPADVRYTLPVVATLFLELARFGQDSHPDAAATVATGAAAAFAEIEAAGASPEVFAAAAAFEAPAFTEATATLLVAARDVCGQDVGAPGVVDDPLQGGAN